MAEIAFTKAHGTENDFIVLPDPDGELNLTVPIIQSLCDRPKGLGADGILRVTRTAQFPEAPADTLSTEWFMDYRNADGSIAEMCGNGVRVFAHYLLTAGLVQPGEFVIGTRAGPRSVQALSPGRSTVSMGPAKIQGTSSATLCGQHYAGVAVNVGNPHLVCATAQDVRELDLSIQPGFDHSMFPEGVNVEFFHRLDPHTLQMRVFERGVGETRSCGTGIVATAAAALFHDGQETGEMTVLVPGGRLEVGIWPDGSSLTGPSVLVASGTIDQSWWNQTAR